jgi:hypothetical protein
MPCIGAACGVVPGTGDAVFGAGVLALAVLFIGVAADFFLAGALAFAAGFFATAFLLAAFFTLVVAVLVTLLPATTFFFACTLVFAAFFLAAIQFLHQPDT